MPKPGLIILPYEFSIHRYEPSEKIPIELLDDNFFWIGKTDEELSVVCKSGLQLSSSRSDHNWSAIKAAGPFDLAIVGILADITRVLSSKKISIFALSTYDTDYILVKKDKMKEAVDALVSEGYSLI